MPKTRAVKTTRSSPENLFFIFIKIFLKKLMIEPIITTGCIFVGNSPNTASIANDNKNETNINKKILFILYINSIILYNIYNKKINNLL